VALKGDSQMASPYEELIKRAKDSSVPVDDLLREALDVAYQFELPDLKGTPNEIDFEWIQHELEGYPDRVPLPDYRLHGRGIEKDSIRQSWPELQSANTYLHEGGCIIGGPQTIQRIENAVRDRVLEWALTLKIRAIAATQEQASSRDFRKLVFWAAAAVILMAIGAYLGSEDLRRVAIRAIIFAAVIAIIFYFKEKT